MNINHPTGQDIPALRHLWQEAFGDTEGYLDAFFATAFAIDRCLCVDGGKAACYWLPCHCRGQKIAYLYAVATAKDARGQGLCRALIEETKKALLMQGYAGILLVPGSEVLRQMYAKMGFENATQIAEFSLAAIKAPRLASPERGGGSEGAGGVWELSAQPTEGVNASVSNVRWEVMTPAAYAQARAALLPEGAAIEGEEFFQFLASQVAFYRFGDALFACAKENDHLFIPEYRGDPDLLPQILAVFGATHATVRTPGSGKKWAMYCPLNGSPAPAHFSFALD